MKPYKELADDIMASESSLKRYIKELADSDLIIRRQALYSRKDHEGVFQVKKGCYIHPAQKLLDLISPKASSKPVENQQKTVEEPKSIHEVKTAPCSTINKNERIEKLNLSGSYIRDLFSSLNTNIITDSQIVTSVDNPEQARRQSQFDIISNYITQEIKEEVPEAIKALIISTFCNLIFKHHKELSSPKQIAAEYLWALLNIDFYLPWTKDIVFRNNILAKMIRNNNWRTPKGFFKHSWLGNEFKRPDEVEKDWNVVKNQEIHDSRHVQSLIEQGGAIDTKDPRLEAVEEQMYVKSKQIDALRERILQCDTEEMIHKVRDDIQKAHRELDLLWQQQAELEQAIQVCA